MEFLDKIDISKEMLSNMPINNKKNKEKYVAFIEDLKNEYTEIKNELYEEMKKRYFNKTKDVKLNNDIEKLEVTLKDMEKVLHVLNPLKTPYEKMGLDENIWRLKRFYKDNLENVNKEILHCIDSFESIGINLSADNFTYTKFTKEYMQIFFEEKNNLNSERLKKAFEDIYWKCPEIIVHLELNIRFLYLQKENTIKKFYEKAKDSILKDLKLKESEVYEKYIDLKKNIENLIDTDKYTILNNFLDKKININDYLPKKIEKEYSKLIDISLLENKETKESILKLYNNISEYKDFIKFKFIFTDIKEHYMEKDKYKKIYDDTLKKIQIEEKKLEKLNESKKTFFLFRKKDEDINVQYSELIKNIQNLYKELDKVKIYNKIYTDLNSEATIFDVFKFAYSFKPYVRDISIIYNPDITPEEIDQLIIDFENFVRSSNLQIINNILMLEDKDISLIIKDRYSLLKFNITKDDVQEQNIDVLYQTLKKLKLDIDIERAGMNINQIYEIYSLYENIN